MGEKDAGTVKIVLPSRAEFLLVARLATSGVGSRADLTVDDIDDLKLAVTEACTNVINHAFDDSVKASDRVIKLQMSVGDGEVTVEIEDEGRGFDPNELERSKRNGLDGKGGLGFGLMKNVTDSFRVESAPGSGTRVIMVKRATR